MQHKALAPEAPSVPCQDPGPPSTRDDPSDGMSTATGVARIPEFLAAEILDCDGWLRTGALGEDQCHQAPCRFNNPSWGEERESKDCGKQQGPGSIPGWENKDTSVTRSVSPACAQPRLSCLVPLQGTVPPSYFFQVAFPEPLQTSRAINSS